ncbi:MAG: transglutaminase family protein [bacterium]
MQKDKQLVEALVTLLSDDDESVAQTAQNKLIELGADVIPDLEEHLDDQPLKVKIRAREVMNQLESKTLEEEFRSLPTHYDGDIDLEEALFTLAKIEYPSLHPKPFRQEINKISERVEEALGRWDVRDARTTVETVNKVLFEKLGFEGNSENYYNSDNSFINRVIQRRTGIPITLSALMLLVAERQDLPFKGVGMPAHFIVSYPGEKERIFIDPFNGGKTLTKNDCANFLAKTGFGFVEEYLQPVSNKEIIERCLRNLINVYHKRERENQVQAVRSYLAIIERQY